MPMSRPCQMEHAFVQNVPYGETVPEGKLMSRPFKRRVSMSRPCQMENAFVQNVPDETPGPDILRIER